MLRQRGRVGLMAAALVGLMVGGAQAAVTTERSASILVFPKVISDGTRDTIIQITNTSNSMVHAHCFYVNGALTFPEFPPGPINPPLWTEIDFDIWLTKQQPTHWVVSLGRLEDPTDASCTNGSLNPPTPPFFGCNGAGLDPGHVPPQGEAFPGQIFTGELKCIEVDETGAPVSGNHLKGEATLVTLDVCNPFTDACEVFGNSCTSNTDCGGPIDVAKYNAIGIPGNENNNGDNVLCLGGQVSETCPNGAEYDACPQTWIANVFSEGAPDPVDVAFDEADPDDSFVNTAFTIVPCTQDFESQTPETVQINVLAWNEFEQQFSTGFPVTCWRELFLDEIDPVTFLFSTMGTSFVQARLRPSAQTASGFLMIGEEFHTVDADSDGYTSVAAVNYHVEGERPGDLITIPFGQGGGGAGTTP